VLIQHTLTCGHDVWDKPDARTIYEGKIDKSFDGQITIVGVDLKTRCIDCDKEFNYVPPNGNRLKRAKRRGDKARRGKARPINAKSRVGRGSGTGKDVRSKKVRKRAVEKGL
jgi:hypothetical protein